MDCFEEMDCLEETRDGDFESFLTVGCFTIGYWVGYAVGCGSGCNGWLSRLDDSRCAFLEIVGLVLSISGAGNVMFSIVWSGDRDFLRLLLLLRFFLACMLFCLFSTDSFSSRCYFCLSSCLLYKETNLIMNLALVSSCMSSDCSIWDPRETTCSRVIGSCLMYMFVVSFKISCSCRVNIFSKLSTIA